jgi:hypothetical protein
MNNNNRMEKLFMLPLFEPAASQNDESGKNEWYSSSLYIALIRPGVAAPVWGTLKSCK